MVENDGILPTYTSEQGKKRKAVRPVRAELDLPDSAKLINGRRRVELGHLEGRSNNLDITPVWNSTPTDNRALCEWVLHTDPGSNFTIHILSERAGSLRQSVELL